MPNALDQLMARDPKIVAQLLAGGDQNLSLPMNIPTTPPEPTLGEAFLSDLQKAPGRIYQMFLGGPLEALAGLGETLMDPGQVEIDAEGNVSPIDPRLVDNAADLALNFGGPAAVGASVSRPDPNLLNIFAGVRAKTADLDKKAIATEMAKNFSKLNNNPGITNDQVNEIYAATGWFPGADSKWRFEIPDNLRARAGLPNPDDMFLKYAAEQKQIWGNRATPQALWRNAAVAIPPLTREGTIPQFIEHPGLFDAYPELKELRTKATGAPGQFPSGVNNRDGSIEATGGTQADLISVLLHEIQHGVQDIEGFANGGNPEWTKHQLARMVPNAAEQLQYPAPYDIYHALMGEVEARQVQNRYELGYSMGNDPRSEVTAPTLQAPDAFGPDIARQLQLHPMWLENPMSLPGATSWDSGEELLREKLKRFASVLQPPNSK